MCFKDLKVKAKEIVTSVKGKVACAVGAAAATMGVTIPAFAEGNSEAVSAAQSLMEAATSTLNIGNIVAIIGAGIGAVIGIFLAWWGARKLLSMLMNAFKKGKVSM